MSTAPQKLLIIDDEVDVHYSFQRLLANDGLSIITAGSGEEGLKLVKKEKPDLVVMDIRMGKQNGLDTLREIRLVNSKQLVIMMTAYGTSQTAIEAMKLGAFDYVLKPFDIPQLMELIKRALEAANAMKEIVVLPAQLDPEDFRSGIIGKSSPMQQVYKLIGQVAPAEATVLVTGESGTGKELVARAIYSNSHRANKIFVALNCAAIPENLLESELFGHEKGAFTGAVTQRIGKFEQCDGGTLFLDEIGEMPITTQSKMLRVLQDGEFSRVGSNDSIRTNVRIIAATNRNLWDAVQQRTFREDLFYRLNVVSIHLPPLRDRPSDLPALVSYFINKWRSRNASGPSKIAEDAIESLAAYPWPGNVRELENCIQRAMVLAAGDTILAKDLPAEVQQARASRPAQAAAPAPTPEADGFQLPSTPPIAPASSNATMQERLDMAFSILFEHAHNTKDYELIPATEREMIVRALELTAGNQVKAAQILGITRATLRKRVEKFGIQKKMKIN
jgi:DNA-binding NtrC family response regulator